MKTKPTMSMFVKREDLNAELVVWYEAKIEKLLHTLEGISELHDDYGNYLRAKNALDKYWNE